jgi:hypothetical protein
MNFVNIGQCVECFSLFETNFFDLTCPTAMLLWFSCNTANYSLCKIVAYRFCNRTRYGALVVTLLFPGMIATALIAVANLYGPGLERVFNTAPIPGIFWGLLFTFALGILCVETLKLIMRTYPKVSAQLSQLISTYIHRASLPSGQHSYSSCHSSYDTYKY